MIGVAPSILTCAHEHNMALSEEIRTMASGQYLSNVAYWLAKQPPETFPDSIYILTEEGTFQNYHICSLGLTPELYGYCLLPVDVRSRDIKVIFRGTELSEVGYKSGKSMLINLEPWGPGVTSFAENKSMLFAKLRNAINTHYGDSMSPLSLQVYGHSQGGALSQLFINDFLLQRMIHSDFDKIDAISMTVLNSPGVPYDTAELCNQRLQWQSIVGKPLKRMVANFGMVGGDLVQTTGLDMIFVALPYPIVEVNLMKVNKNLEGYWCKDFDFSDGVSLAELILTKENIIASLMGAHTNQNFFGPSNEITAADTADPFKIHVNTDYLYFSNRNQDDILVLQKELLNKLPASLCVPFYIFTEKVIESDALLAVELAGKLILGFGFQLSDIGKSLLGWIYKRNLPTIRAMQGQSSTDSFAPLLDSDPIDSTTDTPPLQGSEASCSYYRYMP